jgi:hypothetical protein
MSYKSFEQKLFFDFVKKKKKVFSKVKKKHFGMIFFFSVSLMLMCHIFNMKQFSRDFDVKNDLISKKFENLKFL